jgi:hypothetical protein
LTLLGPNSPWQIKLVFSGAAARRSVLQGSEKIFIIFFSPNIRAEEINHLESIVLSPQLCIDLKRFGFVASQEIVSFTNHSDSYNQSESNITSTNSDLTQASNKDVSNHIQTIVGATSGAICAVGVLLYALYRRSRLKDEGKSHSGSLEVITSEAALTAFKMNLDRDVAKCHTPDKLEMVQNPEGYEESNNSDVLHCPMAGATSIADARKHTKWSEVSPYSKELDDITGLISRTKLSIHSFTDSERLQLLEQRPQESNEDEIEVSEVDRAAISQLIRRASFELQDGRALQSDLKGETTESKMPDGPLTEDHWLVLKLMCQQYENVDFGEGGWGLMMNDGKLQPADVSRLNQKPVANENSADQPVNICTISEPNSNAGSLSEASGVNSLQKDNSLAEILMLLNKCDLVPSYLLHKDTRRIIEDCLGRREDALEDEHLAVLQLLSKAEIDSDLSVCPDPSRRRLLEQRLHDGPLRPRHLAAVQELTRLRASLQGDGLLQSNETLLQEVVDSNVPAFDSAPPQLSETSIRADDGDLKTTRLQMQAPMDLIGPDDTAPELRARINPSMPGTPSIMIEPLSVRRVPLLSREDKEALELVELLENTAKIRRSLPEWVRSGLLPPPRTAANPKLQSTGDKDAVVISCNVTADVVFLNDALHVSRAKEIARRRGKTSDVPKTIKGMYSSLLSNTIAADSSPTPTCDRKETEEGGALVKSSSLLGPKESPALITPFECNAVGSQPDVLVADKQAGKLYSFWKWVIDLVARCCCFCLSWGQRSPRAWSD